VPTPARDKKKIQEKLESKQNRVMNESSILKSGVVLVFPSRLLYTPASNIIIPQQLEAEKGKLVQFLFCR
jgi:hypothetical protein